MSKIEQIETQYHMSSFYVSSACCYIWGDTYCGSSKMVLVHWSTSTKIYVQALLASTKIFYWSNILLNCHARFKEGINITRLSRSTFSGSWHDGCKRDILINTIIIHGFRVVNSNDRTLRAYIIDWVKMYHIDMQRTYASLVAAC